MDSESRLLVNFLHSVVFVLKYGIKTNHKRDNKKGQRVYFCFYCNFFQHSLFRIYLLRNVNCVKPPLFLKFDSLYSEKPFFQF